MDFIKVDESVFIMIVIEFDEGLKEDCKFVTRVVTG